MNWPTLVLPVLLIIAIAFYMTRYRTVLTKLPRPQEKSDAAFALSCHPMKKSDILPLIIVVAVYSVVAFLNLGDMDAPQSGCEFTYPSSSVVTVDFGESLPVGSIACFTGLNTGTYDIECSEDGIVWTDYPDFTLSQEYNDLFKWQYVFSGGDLDGNPVTARYLRVRASNSGMELLELAVFDLYEQLYDASAFITEAPELFDEQELVPEMMTYMNSMYFDEIYHARTAQEHLRNIYPYEISHPPLGKLIIAIGIKMFGMTPFGWRFMGTLFGVLMLIPFYILLKNIFGKTLIAACGTVIFALDFMHFVQTRISTIDTYGVFFIILSYLFMYRYVSSELGAPVINTFKPLFLSGLFFGLGCASKWTVIYAGAGLAVIYAIYLIRRGVWTIKAEKGPEYAAFLISTLSASMLFFVIIPLVIYCASYLPYWTAQGHTASEASTSSEYLKMVWDNQTYMFNYHSGVDQVHPYESRWYQWIVDARPILYFLEYGEGTKSAFASFNSPLVSWAGLLALLSLIYTAVKNRCGVSLFIIIGYFSQLAPWFFISRTTFAYHYFPSSVFLVLALCYVMDKLYDAGHRSMAMAPAAVNTALFAAFYPVLTGVETSTQYCNLFLKWLPSWPLG